MRRSIVYALILFFLKIVVINATPVAKNGRINLSDADFSKAIRLDGEWEFFPKQLLKPELLNITDYKSVYMTVPSSWRAQNSVLSPFGLPENGTYRLIISIDPTKHEQELAFYFDFIPTAFDVWINGAYKGGVGQVSQNRNEFRPVANQLLVLHNINNDANFLGNELELVVRVSNYKHFNAGILNSVLIADKSVLQNKIRYRQLWAAFILGILLIAVLISLILWYFNYERNTNIYLAGTQTFLALWIISFNKLLLTFWPDVPWELAVSMEYSAAYGTVALVILFFLSYFKHTRMKNTLQILSMLGLFIVFFTLFAPVKVFIRFKIIYDLYIFVAAVLVLVMVLMEVSKNWKEHVLFVVSLFFLFLALLHDLFVSFFFLGDNYWAQYVYSLFIISFTIELQRRFIRTYRQNKQLSFQLEKQNRNLEKMVVNRTSQLERLNVEVAQQAEYLAEVNDNKDRLFAIIAHDLRSPMASLKSLLDFFDGEKYDTRELLELIKQSVNANFELLENLLLWAESQRNEVRYNPQAFNLYDLVNKVLNLVDGQALQKQIIIRNEVVRFTQVFADLNQMEAVIRNLVSNAIKFTPKGGEIIIECAKEDNGRMTRISVSDTGIGMDAQTLEQIKNPEKYYTQPGTENEKGSGLGLKLCRTFIEANGSVMEIDSRVGQGTTISFLLHVKRPD